MQIDLNSLSLDELKTLQKQVKSTIDNYEARVRREALAAVERKAREMGFSLSDLTGDAATTRRRGHLPPKYANPDNPAQTWSGRGRRPRWFTEALEAGKAPDDLLI